MYKCNMCTYIHSNVCAMLVCVCMAKCEKPSLDAQEIKSFLLLATLVNCIFSLQKCNSSIYVHYK